MPVDLGLFSLGYQFKVQEQSEMNQIDTVYIHRHFVMNEVHMYSTYLPTYSGKLLLDCSHLFD